MYSLKKQQTKPILVDPSSESIISYNRIKNNDYKFLNIEKIFIIKELVYIYQRKEYNFVIYKTIVSDYISYRLIYFLDKEECFGGDVLCYKTLIDIDSNELYIRDYITQNLYDNLKKKDNEEIDINIILNEKIKDIFILDYSKIFNKKIFEKSEIKEAFFFTEEDESFYKRKEKISTYNEEKI